MPDQISGQTPSGNLENPSPPQPIPSPIEQGKVRDHSNGDANGNQPDAKSFAKEIHWVHSATLGTQVVLGIVGIFALVIYHGQLTVMSGQLEEMRRASQQSKLDNAASITAQKEIAQSALATSQDNFTKSQNATAEQMRLDERAWVTEVAISGEPQVEHPFAITVEVKNTGKTPARNFQGKIVSDPSPRGGEPNLAKLKAVRYAGSGILAPNASKFLTSYPINGSATEKFSKEAMDDLKTKTLYVFGRVEYDDIFNCHHWTTFCMFLDPRENYRKYSMCKKHNDADDNRCTVTAVTKTVMP